MTTAGKDTTFLKKYSLNIHGDVKDFHNVLIMGILNLTPDSFYHTSRLSSDSEVLDRAEQMISEGADILDLGAYSSRPGATHISEEEEEKRLISKISLIRREFPEMLISVDTFRSRIALKAIDAGGSMINDISGGQLDEDMHSMVASLHVPYILMHMRGNPQNMQKNLVYEDVVGDVYRFFSERVKLARKAGIHDIILDPGFGFGKSLEDNYRLLKSMGEFKAFNCMLLAGVSRKSMITKLLDIKAADALNGTTVLNTLALLGGANILRVHDVKAGKEAASLVSYWQKA